MVRKKQQQNIKSSCSLDFEFVAFAKVKKEEFCAGVSESAGRDYHRFLASLNESMIFR
jgi:hypothetical protein